MIRRSALAVVVIAAISLPVGISISRSRTPPEPAGSELVSAGVTSSTTFSMTPSPHVALHVPSSDAAAPVFRDGALADERDSREIDALVARGRIHEAHWRAQLFVQH